MTTISLRPLPLRLLLLLALAAGLVLLGYLIARAAVGDSIITYALRAADLTPAARLEGADAGVRLAERDPLTHLRRGSLYLAQASEENPEERLATAVSELRTALSMSPEDYRIWLALGRALERQGAAGEARRTLARASQLAPNHFEVRWTLGNHLLRAGARDEAFAEFRIALTNQPTALPLIFDYAWQSYGGDGRAIIRALGPPAAARVKLASLLIYRGRVEEGLTLWRETSPQTLEDARLMIDTLAGVGRYAAAYDIWRAATGGLQPDAGSLLANGGFEDEIKLDAPEPFFAWRLARSQGLTLSLDAKARPGENDGGKEQPTKNRALRLTFDAKHLPVLTVVAQTVPLTRGTYRLSFRYKTEELRNISSLFVDVSDPAKSVQSLGSFEVPIGTHKWTLQHLDFTSPLATEAVTVRLHQTVCGDPPCPAEGRVWFDDFKLAKR